ncbi:MAG: ADP-ribosylglycohydrolase family protein [Halieaceae bacterium]|nr:ADP-ribosylglycohydrolase family protein [Halieaceae bacterium]
MIIQALRAYRKTDHSYSGSTDEKSAGNGSLMRLAPVAIYYSSQPDVAIQHAKLSPATTHQAHDCLSATGWFAELLVRTMTQECDKSTLLAPPFKADLSPNIQALAQGSYRTKTRDQIKGSGWVVESLEAALWAFWQGESFEEAILLAVNLGDDADTTAAITGQLAGAFYGLDGIPDTWLYKLYIKDHIDRLARALADASAQRKIKSQAV